MTFARVTIQPGEMSGNQMTDAMSARLETGAFAEVEYQKPNSGAYKSICEIGIEQGSGDGWVYRGFTPR